VNALSGAGARIRHQVSDAEWKKRLDLAALYRAIHMFGMTDMIANHITARVPDEPDHILLNAYGLMYDEVTAANLYKVDLDGRVILAPEGDYRINPTGYVIHGAIHSVRHDVDVIVHTHTRAGVGVASMACGLLPLSQHAAILGEVSYHDFWAPSVDFAERKSLIDDLGENNLMILRNHGLLACGRSVAHAFANIFRLETACRIQIDAMAGGMDNVLLLEKSHLESTQKVVREDLGSASAAIQWEAVLRRLSRTYGSLEE
tara:strand:+ start:7703 stop:8482 length:780 start_codon:yes stop_codon:yes gene_type:complete